jgi:dihydrofolate reductase
MRRLTFAMNLSLDGYIAAPGDDIGGATLAAAAMRAGLIDEYVLVTAPVLVGSGTPFFTALDNWVNLTMVEIRTFPDGVVLTRYETRR